MLGSFGVKAQNSIIPSADNIGAMHNYVYQQLFLEKTKNELYKMGPEGIGLEIIEIMMKAHPKVYTRKDLVDGKNLIYNLLDKQGVSKTNIRYKDLINLTNFLNRQNKIGSKSKNDILENLNNAKSGNFNLVTKNIAAMKTKSYSYEDRKIRDIFINIYSASNDLHNSGGGYTTRSYLTVFCDALGGTLGVGMTGNPIVGLWGGAYFSSLAILYEEQN